LQVTLINAVAAAAKSPVTVVFFCANPLDVSMLMNNDKIGAIFYGEPTHHVHHSVVLISILSFITSLASSRTACVD
jgi:hypothetical protein